MALVKCKECGAEISDKADKCPQCGYSKPSIPNGTGCLGVIILITLLYMCSPDKDTSEEREASAERAAAQRNPIDSARGACWIAIKQSLNDPGSAETIGKIKDWSLMTKPDGSITVYPKIRAKNGFGALMASQWECVVVDGPGNNVTVRSIKQL